MANRHKRFRSGGRAIHGPIHSGASSPVVKSARQGTHGFEVGGAVGGKAKATAVRRARGGSVFSKAASSLKGSGGHAGAPKHGGGRGKFALGGTVTPQLAKGGQVKTRRHGGKCEDDEEEDDEEEEEGHKRGGRAKKKEGMHYWAKGGRTGNWIAGAIKHPGALHKSLGVPEGQKIPAKKLDKAEHSSNPKTARRARLAETLKGLHH